MDRCAGLCPVGGTKVKQIFRLITQPGLFFNQLQWSSHHWFMLIAFLGLALIETHVGRGQNEYFQLGLWIHKSWGLTFNHALWVVLALRLAFIAAGAYLVTTAVWVVGNIFGRKTSRRVLARRLAVVFSVALAAYTTQYFVDSHALFGFASLILYFWSVVLGYFAIRENFSLSHLESVVVGLFALLLVTTTWHYAHHALNDRVQAFAEAEMKTTSSAHAPKASYIHIK